MWLKEILHRQGTRGLRASCRASLRTTWEAWLERGIIKDRREEKFYKIRDSLSPTTTLLYGIIRTKRKQRNKNVNKGRVWCPVSHPSCACPTPPASPSTPSQAPRSALSPNPTIFGEKSILFRNISDQICQRSTCLFREERSCRRTDSKLELQRRAFYLRPIILDATTICILQGKSTISY